MQPNQILALFEIPQQLRDTTQYRRETRINMLVEMERLMRTDPKAVVAPITIGLISEAFNDAIAELRAEIAAEAVRAPAKEKPVAAKPKRKAPRKKADTPKEGEETAAKE